MRVCEGFGKLAFFVVDSRYDASSQNLQKMCLKRFAFKTARSPPELRGRERRGRLAPLNFGGCKMVAIQKGVGHYADKNEVAATNLRTLRSENYRDDREA